MASGPFLIAHNIGVVECIADQVAVTQAGRIVEQGASEAVLQRPQHVTTRTLLAAVPRLVSVQWHTRGNAIVVYSQRAGNSGPVHWRRRDMRIAGSCTSERNPPHGVSPMFTPLCRAPCTMHVLRRSASRACRAAVRKEFPGAGP